MENVIIWGLGKLGKNSWVNKFVGNYYNIKGYCDNAAKEREVFNGLPVLLPNELHGFCEKECVNTFILTVRQEKVKEIEKQIKELLSSTMELEILSLMDVKDNVEGDYIQKMVQRKGIWKVDTKNQFRIWLDNIMSEVEFWIGSVAKENGEYHYDYLQRIKKHMFGSFDEDILFFEKTLHEGAKVMDIGCGLAPRYGDKTRFGYNLSIERVDPLAHFYNSINNKFAQNAELDLLCKYGLFEYIANFYAQGLFDGVIVSNALDHCFNPFKALIEMLYIVKKGGCIYTNHRRAEAVFENYRGLHKFNIDYTKNNEMVIWNEDNIVNVSEELKTIANIEVIHTNDNVKRLDSKVISLITKKREFELEEFINIEDERRELAYLSDCVLEFFLEHDIHRKFKEYME